MGFEEAGEYLKMIEEYYENYRNNQFLNKNFPIA